MAEMVEQLRSQRLDPVKDAPEVDGLVGPGGVAFVRVQTDMSPNQAVLAVRAGALVVWDPCGCGGYCGYDWLDVDRRQALLRAERPRIGRRPKKGRWGSVSLWRSGSGIELLLATADVRWGAELA
jgi:hypothetical protein